MFLTIPDWDYVTPSLSVWYEINMKTGREHEDQTRAKEVETNLRNYIMQTLTFSSQIIR